MSKIISFFDNNHHEGGSCPDKQMPVLSGDSGLEIAESLAIIMNMDFIKLETRKFPDGESYVRVPEDAVESIRSEEVILVSNTFPDSGIMKTIFNINSITLIVVF